MNDLVRILKEIKKNPVSRPPDFISELLSLNEIKLMRKRMKRG